MKKNALLMLMVISCTLFFAFTTFRNSTDIKSAYRTSSKLSLIKTTTPATSKNRLFNKPKQSTCTITFTQGSNVSGSWVLEMSSSGGTFQIPVNRSVPVPYGTYSYVGIHAAGGTSQNYSISGSLCTNSYSAYGTSALFSNVVVSCGSGSFSVN